MGVDPPPVTVALKTTEAPAHAVVLAVEILMVGFTSGVIVSATEEEVVEQVVEPFSVMITAYVPV